MPTLLLLVVFYITQIVICICSNFTFMFSCQIYICIRFLFQPILTIKNVFHSRVWNICTTHPANSHLLSSILHVILQAEVLEFWQNCKHNRTDNAYSPDCSFYKAFYIPITLTISCMHRAWCLKPGSNSLLFNVNTAT